MTVHPHAIAIADRADAERADGLIETLRADPSTRVLVVRGDVAPFSDDAHLHYVAPDEAPSDAEWAFLGRTADGTGVLAAAVAPDAEPPFRARWGSLRGEGGGLADAEAATFVTAVSLGRWLLDAAFCPACGDRADLQLAGWARRCRGCGREHFPRTDPAVIVAITSARDPDRLLLGSNVLWEQARYSCFAGFVEAGESLESAVVREVQEEAGVVVTDVQYRGSQAWPYPRSLMLGFFATAVDDDAARPDGTEIVTLRWFDRDEIGAGLAGDSAILLPGPASIAHRLISDWYARR